MINNIHLIQELIRKYSRKRISPRCMLKIDLRKAYDTVEWSFLEAMLKALGFCDTFCAWTMQCVTSTAYSLSLNGAGFSRGLED